jgi:hypothetical protein
VAFNGEGLQNCVRWVGTESGLPDYPLWSTSGGDGGGDPRSSEWCPAAADTVSDGGRGWERGDWGVGLGYVSYRNRYQCEGCLIC